MLYIFCKKIKDWKKLQLSLLRVLQCSFLFMARLSVALDENLKYKMITGIINQNVKIIDEIINS